MHERIAPLTRSSPCEDYRIEGRDRFKTMTLDAHEFIRRFLLHVLPSGFHRIRHYGLLAGAMRADNIERARQLLAAAEGAPQPSREADNPAEDVSPARRCPCCGGRMIVVETFEGPRPWRSPSPDRDRQLMTALHPASRRRWPSPPAARRSMSVMPARGRRPSFHQAQPLASAPRRHRQRPPSALLLETPSAAGRRSLARQTSAILKSP